LIFAAIGSPSASRNLRQNQTIWQLTERVLDHNIRAGPDDGGAADECTHVITHVRGSHREVTMHRSHQKLSRLVTAAVIAAGCVAFSAGPSDAAAVHNGPIAFGRFDPALGDFSLWTADSDGTHQRPLTTVPSFMPNWAPDGARVAFDFPDDTGEHIATIRYDGTGQRQLTFGPGIQGDARYSHDGRLLAFDASTLLPDDPAFTTDIWVMAVDGSHPRQVTRGGFDVEPVFSPDGQQIAFGRITGLDPNNFQQSEAVYVVRTDGTDLHEIVPSRPGLEHPAWSPDGSRLVFNISPEAQGAPGAGSVFAVDPSGAGLHVVRAASAHWFFFKPVWSPDGRKLLVGCHRVTTGTENLCVMNPDSGRLDVVVSAPPSRPVNFPAWGPKRR